MNIKFDGTPYDMKMSRTVWNGGKGGDNIKTLPIVIRVVLMNKQGEREIEKIYGLDKYLKYLENQLGGHGNRICIVKKQTGD